VTRQKYLEQRNAEIVMQNNRVYERAMRMGVEFRKEQDNSKIWGSAMASVKDDER